MNISLPERLKGWAQRRVDEGRYSSASDYVRDLIRRDQEGAERLERLQSAVSDGLASPITDTTIEDIIAASRERG